MQITSFFNARSLLLGTTTALGETRRSDGLTPPVVSTTSGKVHGLLDPALPNVHQYLGIPYAVPPVGPRRWTAPELLNTPDAYVQATVLPPSCIQHLDRSASSLFTMEVLEFNLQGLNTTGPVSEDCLTISVWAPARAATEKPVPVVLSFHGGSQISGGQDVPYQIPAKWVDRTPDHIVVTFHYRLNIFGSPSAGGLDEQNFLLLDQRAAVEWCQRNIAAFGGDPERMVVWGESAGSVDANYYSFAYPDDPIVSGFIMDSGVALGPEGKNDTTFSNFTLVAENVGCAGLAADFKAQLECMRGVDALVIDEFISGYQASGRLPAIWFVPAWDERSVFGNYTQRSTAGLQAKVVSEPGVLRIGLPTYQVAFGRSANSAQPAIVSNTANEGAAFVVPYDPTGLNQTLADACTLSFLCPITYAVGLRQLAGLTTFRYVYEGNFSNISPKPWLGAYHASQVPLLMGTHSDFRGGSTPEEEATSAAIQDAYVAFARDGTVESQGWTPYAKLGDGNVRIFGRDGVPAQDTSIAEEELKCVPKSSSTGAATMVLNRR